MSFYDTRPATLDETNPNAFWWPTPPFAAYPQVETSSGPIKGMLEGMNQKTTRTLLMHFDLRGGMISVQIARGQKPITVRFQQFRRLDLDEPINPDAANTADPHADLLSHHPVAPFVVTYGDGNVLEGNTIGHVELEQGLFLFPPLGNVGSVSRMFIPRHAYRSYSVGSRVGEILVAQASVSAGELNRVIVEQDNLRTRKLGDVLVSNQII